MAKRITIEVHYIGNYNSKIMQVGTFKVNPSAYIKNKVRESARAAYAFIKQIRMEHPDARIEKVVCNGEDFTENVMQFLPNHKYLFRI